MNWIKVTQTLQTRSRELLTDAKAMIANGEVHSGQANLIVASTLLALADALREGIRDEGPRLTHSFTDGILP